MQAFFLFLQVFSKNRLIFEDFLYDFCDIFAFEMGLEAN
jgi:hypothetical protein